MNYLGRTCPECLGAGFFDECCSECESLHEEECESCLGTGWGAATIDVAAYRRECEAFQKRELATWELMDGGKSIGRASHRGRVLVSDFVRITT